MLDTWVIVGASVAYVLGLWFGIAYYVDRKAAVAGRSVINHPDASTPSR